MAYTDYLDAVQKAYIAYYGRPADPEGLIYWAGRADTAGSLAAVLSAFGSSAESTSLYSNASYSGKIDQMYLQVLGRHADTDGLNYYLNEVLSGRMTLTTVAYNIIDGVTGGDVATVANKLTAANDFTNALDTPTERDSYSGTTAATSARSFLSSVTSDTATVTAAATNKTTTINTMVSDAAVVAGQTFTLTTGADNKVGGTGNDSFDASLSSASMTFGAADSIDGGDGTDTLTIDVNGTSSYRAASLQNVESVVGHFSAAGTINLLGATGVTSAEASGSSAASTFSNIASTSTALKATAIGDSALTYGFVSSAVTGSSDTADLTLAGVSQVGATATTINGVETIAVASGSSANTLGALVGDTLTKVTVSGDQELTISTALAAAVTTVDANVATGAVTVTLGSAATATVTGGSGNDSLNIASVTGNANVNAGAGDDTITTGTNLATTDTINGGDGTADTLSVAAATASAYTAPDTATISNIERISLSTAMAGETVATSNFGTIDTVTLAAGGNGTLTLGAGTKTVNLNAALNGGLSVGDTGSATTDALTIANKAAATNIGAGNAITVTGFETVTINTTGTGAATQQTFSTIGVTPDTGGTATLNLSGTNAVRATGAITADVISAAGLTAASTGNTFQMDAAAVGVESITGSAGNDTLVGDTSGYIDGGAGIDNITGGSGNDTLVGGAGNDTITTDAGADSVSAGAGNDTIILAGNLTGADTIDGGDDTDTLSISTSVNAGMIANVSNVENLAITGASTAVTMASNLGFQTFDLSAASRQDLTLSDGYTGATTIEVGDNAGNSTDRITNGANVELTVQGTGVEMAGGTLYITGGTGNDVINVTADGTYGGGSVTNALNFNGVISGVETVTVLDGGDAVSTSGKDFQLTLGSYSTNLTVNAAAMDGSDEQFVLSGASATGKLTVTGGSAADSIVAGSGNDNIDGGSGNDTITGSGGIDTLVGGAGDDSITGGSSNDSITGDAGNDTIDTGNGINTVTGGDGNDIITAGSGNDSIDAGAGNDTFKLNEDNLTTNDTLAGGEGSDTLQIETLGTALADADFTNVSSVETLTAGTGNALRATMGAQAAEMGAATLTGGSGSDDVTFSSAFSNATVTISAIGTGSDTFNASASAVAVTLKATETQITSADALSGGSGTSDVLEITADSSATLDLDNVSGFETITIKSNGSDDVTIAKIEAASNKTVSINASEMSLSTTSLIITDIGSSNAGSFNITGGEGNDSLLGGGYADTLTGGGENDTLDGGAGDDSLSGGSGNDTITTGTGDNTVDAGQGNDTVTGGGGNDTIDGGEGNNNIVAAAGADSIVSGAGNDTLDAGSGNDTISSGGGTDSILGGAGADSINGGAGNDTITGGAGADTIVAGDGNDQIVVATTTDSAHDDSTTFAGDTVDGFDFSVDKFVVDSITSMQVASHTVGSADLDTLDTVLGADAVLNGYLRTGNVDAALVTVSAGTAAGTYMVLSKDGGSGYDTGDIIIKMVNSTNASSFSASNFVASSTLTSGVTSALNVGNSALVLSGSSSGTVVVNPASGTAAALVTDGALAVSTATTNGTYAASGVNSINASGLTSGTNVTVNVLVADVGDYAGSWYTGAGGTDTLAIQDAGDFSALGLTNIDAVTTTAFNGAITLDSTDLTGKTVAFTTDNASDVVNIDLVAAQAASDLSNVSESGAGSIRLKIDNTVAADLTTATANLFGSNIGAAILSGGNGAVTFNSTALTGKTVAFTTDNAADDVVIAVAQAAASATTLSGITISGGAAVIASLSAVGNYSGINLGNATEMVLNAASGTTTLASADITGKTLAVSGDNSGDILKVTLAQADAAAFSSGLTMTTAVAYLSVAGGDFTSLDAADIDYSKIYTDQANAAVTFAALDLAGKTAVFETDNAGDVVKVNVGASDGAMDLHAITENGNGSITYVLTGAGTYTEELEQTDNDDWTGITAVDASAAEGAAIIASTNVTGKTIVFTTDSAADKVQISLAQAATLNALENISETGAGSLEANVTSGDYSGMDANDVIFSVINTNGANGALTFAAEDFSTKTVSFVTDNASDVVNVTVNAAGGSALTLAGLTETGDGSINYLLAAGDYIAEMAAEAFTNVHTVSTSDNGAFTFSGTSLTGKTVAFTTNDATDIVNVTGYASGDFTNVTETGTGSMVLSLASATNYGTITGVSNFASVIVSAAAQVNLGSGGVAVTISGDGNKTLTFSGSAVDTITVVKTDLGGDVFNGLTVGDKLSFDTTAGGTIKDAGGSWDGTASANAGAVAAEGDWYFENSTDLLTYFDATANAATTMTLIGVTSMTSNAGELVVAV